METCAVIADDYGKSLLSEIKTLEKFVGSASPSDVLTPVKTLHDLARFYIGESVLDELLTDNFTNEQIWQQLKIASSSGEKTFENASLQKKRKRTDDATDESMEKKLCTSETADETEGVSDAESDDELKRITDRWNIDGRQSEEDDEDEDDEEDEDDKVEKDEEDADDDLNENLDMSDDENPLDTLKKALKSKKKKTSEVDDKFFSLEDMHSFLDQQDRLATREISEEADEDDNDNYMFLDISSDEDEKDEKNAKYSEFFDDLEEKNATKGDEKDDVEEDDEEEDGDDMEHDSDEENGIKDEDEASGSDSHEDDDDEEEDMEQDDIIDDVIDQHKDNELNKIQKTDNETKSAFQKKQELMKKQITDVEESNLAEKPWHLRGEITAADRPENSLLTTHLDYKFNSAPTIDDDKDVLTIEELLRKYYDSDAFVVNVTRKVKPVGTALKYRKDIILDHEKSKLGLAEILERDYLGQSQTRSQKEEEEYKENRKILDNLLLGLQMMFSNAPVTVMPPKMDLQIVENVPAIVVEEVAPVFVSDAARLTAEEVQGKRKGELIGETEKTKTNRKRERRLKKKFQHQKALQKKVRAADPNSKEAQEEAQKQLERKSKRGKHITIHETDKKKKKLSSKDFFNELQNQVTSSINKKREGIDKKKRKKNKKEQS